jgi:hypothetical protein
VSLLWPCDGKADAALCAAAPGCYSSVGSRGRVYPCWAVVAWIAVGPPICTLALSRVLFPCCCCPASGVSLPAAAVLCGSLSAGGWGGGLPAWQRLGLIPPSWGESARACRLWCCWNWLGRRVGLCPLCVGPNLVPVGSPVLAVLALRRAGMASACVKLSYTCEVLWCPGLEPPGARVLPERAVEERCCAPGLSNPGGTSSSSLGG